VESRQERTVPHRTGFWEGSKSLSINSQAEPLLTCSGSHNSVRSITPMPPQEGTGAITNLPRESSGSSSKAGASFLEGGPCPAPGPQQEVIVNDINIDKKQASVPSHVTPADLPETSRASADPAATSHLTNLPEAQGHTWCAFICHTC
jgi:hypothetical protein